MILNPKGPQIFSSMSSLEFTIDSSDNIFSKSVLSKLFVRNQIKGPNRKLKARVDSQAASRALSSFSVKLLQQQIATATMVTGWHRRRLAILHTSKTATFVALLLLASCSTRCAIWCSTWCVRANWCSTNCWIEAQLSLMCKQFSARSEP